MVRLSGLRAALAACALVLVLPAFAAGDPAATATPDAQAALSKRVLEYWTARKESDLGAAYALYSPQYRASHPRPQFLRDHQRLIRFPPEKVTVEGVEIQPDGKEANVKVRLQLTHNIEGNSIPLDGVTEDAWVLVDGDWWKKDEPLKINL